MKYYILAALSLFLTACTVTQAPIVEYRIKPTITDVTFDGASCKNSSIKVIQAFSSNALMSQKMKYTQDTFSEFAFNQSEWSESPNRAITAEILKSVRASKLFKTVQSYKSRSKSDFTLESTIEEFSQDFDNDASYASAIITMTLVDTKTANVLDSVRFTQRIKSERQDAKSGVVALNKALSEILLQSNVWLNKACQ